MINKINDISAIDISIESTINEKPIQTTIKIIEYVDRRMLFVTNLGRIGHIIEIDFPLMYKAIDNHFLANRRSEHYETKTLLGPDTGEFDLFVARIAKTLLQHQRTEKKIWLMLGLDLDTTKTISYLRQIVEKIDSYYANLK